MGFRKQMNSIVNSHMPRRNSVKANAKENASKKATSAIADENKDFNKPDNEPDDTGDDLPTKTSKKKPGGFVAPNDPDEQLKSTIGGMFQKGGKVKHFDQGGSSGGPLGGIMKLAPLAMMAMADGGKVDNPQLNQDTLDRYGRSELDFHPLPKDVKHGPDVGDPDSDLFEQNSDAIHRVKPAMLSEGGPPFKAPRGGIPSPGRFSDPSESPPRFMTQGADTTDGPGVPPPPPPGSQPPHPPKMGAPGEDPFSQYNRDLPHGNPGAELGADLGGNEVEDAALGSMVKKILGGGLGGIGAGVGMGMLSNSGSTNEGEPQAVRARHESGADAPLDHSDTLSDIPLKGRPQMVGPGQKPQFVNGGYAEGGEVDPVEKAFYKRMHRDKSGPC